MTRKEGNLTKIHLGHYFVVFGPSILEVDLSGPFCKRRNPINRDRIVMLR